MGVEESIDGSIVLSRPTSFLRETVSSILIRSP